MTLSNYDILDERFSPLIREDATVERLYEGCLWAEGPAWFPAHRSLVWSDIPNNRMLRLDEAGGAVSVFRSPSDYANGNTVDRQGRLVTCEHGTRRVTRTEHDGAITVLADRFQGRRFNSPNDVVVKSDGSVWFTDPTYGIDSDYEGVKAPSELDGSHVYRIDLAQGRVTRVLDAFEQPNGIAFSPDERRLYVVDTGSTHRPDGPRHIRVFDAGPDGELTGGAVFAELAEGCFDGLRLDEAGRVWASAGEAVHCYEPDGTLIGRIPIGERTANLVFGGTGRDRLYVTATTSLYAVQVAVKGARTF